MKKENTDNVVTKDYCMFNDTHEGATHEQLAEAVNQLRQREEQLHDILTNFMCNVSAGFNANDWEHVKIGYDTVQAELEHFGFKKFCGHPHLQGEKEGVMKRIKNVIRIVPCSK